MAALSSAGRTRYSRHLALPEVGLEGQQKLAQASVLVAGAGGLGSPAALYLAAAGVGRIGLADFDRVELSNLQRQILHSTADVGRLKVESGRDRLAAFNPEITVETISQRLTADNALDILGHYDVILDGSDNFPTRYLLSDAGVILERPVVYGSVYRFEGQLTVFGPPAGPCYRCLFPVPPPPDSVPSCSTGGVLGVLPGVIGACMAAETLKLLLGVGESLIGRLLLYDSLAARFQEISLSRDPACPRCGAEPTLAGLIDYDEFCGESEQANRALQEAVPQLSPQEVAGRLEELTILDVREPFESHIAALPGALSLPLAELQDGLKDLDAQSPIVVICRSGVRSARAVQQLQAAGFSRVWNLTGGLHAWAETVDPSMAQY